jgi:hypothetical protein
VNLNIIVRGQSNAILLMELDGWAGAGALPREVARLLGFDGSTDTVSLVYEAHDTTSGTAFGGTALVGDWLDPRNGDWRQGWTNDTLERALLAKLGEMPADRRDDPTATLWLHSEYDSANGALTQDQWVSAVRHDAAQVRAALGQQAATTPYLFVSAMPYWGTENGHQVIRRGMEQLAADGSFNGHIAARMLDIDATTDNWDNNWNTVEYGGGHIDGGDAAQTVARAARAIAEAFAAQAKPGSPVASAGGRLADEGPQVTAAQKVAWNQLRVDVTHDQASSFRTLDADAARGVGWSVRGSSVVEGRGAQVVDGDTLLLTFSGEVPTDGRLHYGFGYGRLAGQGGEGRGNAVYDNQGLPIWVRADGLTISGSTTPPPPVTGIVVNGTSGDDWLKGGSGNDTLNGGAGEDDLQGLDGNDVLRAGPGPGLDGLTGGAGADSFVFARGDGQDWVVDFVSGTDRVVLEGFASSEVTTRRATYWDTPGLDIVLPGGDKIFLAGVSALGANDLVLTNVPSTPTPPPPTTPTAGQNLKGTSGADRLTGGAGNDTISGASGADTLTGGAGDDRFNAGPGNDRVIGGTGNDLLTLGDGADIAVFARGDGFDRITDFRRGTDRLELSGFTAAEITTRQATVSGSSGLEVTLGTGGDQVFLSGVTALGAADYILT